MDGCKHADIFYDYQIQTVFCISNMYFQYIYSAHSLVWACKIALIFKFRQWWRLHKCTHTYSVAKPNSCLLSLSIHPKYISISQHNLHHHLILDLRLVGDKNWPSELQLGLHKVYSVQQNLSSPLYSLKHDLDATTKWQLQTASRLQSWRKSGACVNTSLGQGQTSLPGRDIAVLYMLKS